MMQLVRIKLQKDNLAVETVTWALYSTYSEQNKAKWLEFIDILLSRTNLDGNVYFQIAKYKCFHCLKVNFTRISQEKDIIDKSYQFCKLGISRYAKKAAQNDSEVLQNIIFMFNLIYKHSLPLMPWESIVSALHDADPLNFGEWLCQHSKTGDVYDFIKVYRTVKKLSKEKSMEYLNWMVKKCADNKDTSISVNVRADLFILKPSLENFVKVKESCTTQEWANLSHPLLNIINKDTELYASLLASER